MASPGFSGDSDGPVRLDAQSVNQRGRSAPARTSDYRFFSDLCPDGSIVFAHAFRAPVSVDRDCNRCGRPARETGVKARALRPN